MRIVDGFRVARLAAKEWWWLVVKNRADWLKETPDGFPWGGWTGDPIEISHAYFWSYLEGLTQEGDPEVAA